MHISPVDSHPCFSYLVNDQKKEHQVFNVVLKQAQNVALKEYSIKKDESKIVVEGVKGIWDHQYDQNLRKLFDKLFKKYRPDIVHIHVFSGFSLLPILNTASSFRIKKILTLNDHSLICTKGICHEQGRNCDSASYRDCSCGVMLRESNSFHKRIRSIINQSDKILCASKHQRILLEELFGKNQKITHSYCGIKEYSLSKSDVTSKKIFGYAGNLSDVKGLEHIIQAFEGMDNTDYELRFAILADPGEVQNSNVLKKIEALKNATVMINLSHQSEIHEKFYCDLDYCIIPSVWNETGPLTLFESFMHRIPVLINNMESMKEKIQENKSSRIFNNARELAVLIKNIINGKIKKELNDKYPFKTFEVFKQEMFEIYEKALNKKYRMLNFKIGHLCNSKCLYCVAGEAVESFIDLKLLRREMERKASVYDCLVFTGGEPTMYPRFFDLMSIAFYLGYKIEIQSNIRIFSSKKFTEKIKKFNTKIIVCMNSSREDVFDNMAQARGAFKQTIQGVNNLKSAGIIVDTKIIITNDNLDHLKEIVQFVRSFGIDAAIMVFPTPMGLAKQNFMQINPRYTDTISHVTDAVDWGVAHNMRMEIENIPGCFLDEKYHKYIIEYKDMSCIDGVYVTKPRGLYNARKERMNKQKLKVKGCMHCTLSYKCEGVYAEYVRNFGEEEFEPIMVSA